MMGRIQGTHPAGDTSGGILGLAKMNFWSSIRRAVVAVREFVAPTYRPERHYMRGPGPACARRMGMAFEGRASFR